MIDAVDMLTLPPDGRSLSVGRTRSGKTTLTLVLIDKWCQQYPDGIVLIPDTKPCVRGEYEFGGQRATRRYKGWKEGRVIPDSIVLDARYMSIRKARKLLNFLIEAGWKKIIIQANDRQHWYATLSFIQAFYLDAHHKQPRLVVVPELSDFFGTDKVGGVLWQIIRSGGEKGLGFHSETQRPFYIPKVVLTECDRIYLFRLDSRKDMGALYDVGFPEQVNGKVIPVHTFVFYNKLTMNGDEHFPFITLKGV